MNYRPKVVRCRLKTGGKSIPQIREECRGQGLTYRDFENIQRSNEEFDGLVVLLSLWAYDNHASYHLHNWDPADDERMMMAIYYAEQVHPFPRYKNDLAKFKADWAAQAYDPGGASLTFATAWRNWKFSARKRRSRNRPSLPLQSGKSISGGGSKTGNR